MSKAWKAFEDRCCIALGGRRVLGNRGSGVPDSDEDVPFAVEAKHGYEQFRLPAKWLEQAKRNAKASGKPWLIVQAPKHSRAPIATLDFFTFVKIATRAGMLHPSLTDAPLLERFWSKVEKRSEDECWEWQAALNPKGYGHFSIDGHPFLAHRVAYMLTRGAIPKDLMVLHRCGNACCVNPGHLYTGMLPTPLEVGESGESSRAADLEGAQWDPIAGGYRAPDGSHVFADEVQIHRLRKKIAESGESDE